MGTRLRALMGACLAGALVVAAAGSHGATAATAVGEPTLSAVLGDDGAPICDANDEQPDYADIGCVPGEGSAYFASDSDGESLTVRFVLHASPETMSPQQAPYESARYVVAVGQDGNHVATVGLDGKGTVLEDTLYAKCVKSKTPEYEEPTTLTNSVSVDPAPGGLTYLTFTVPLGSLESCVTTDAPVQLFFGTATSGQYDNINKDFFTGNKLDFAEVEPVILTNTPPTADDDELTVAEDGQSSVDVLANDTDEDGDELEVTHFSEPEHGAVTVDDGVFTYTPAPDYSGGDSFTYTVSDGRGGATTATVSLTVTPVNDDPDAVDDEATTTEDESVDVVVLTNDTDVDGDDLAVSSVSDPAHGAAAVNGDGSITYTPDAGWSGSDSFTYTVEDGAGGSDVATVSIVVSAANDAPTAEDDQAEGKAGATVTVEVLANDSDPDGDALTVSISRQGEQGTATANDDGTVTYAADDDGAGDDTFEYSISDGHGGSDVATVTVTIEAATEGDGDGDGEPEPGPVTALNAPPVARDDEAAVDEGSSVTVDVVANDVDPDLDELVLNRIIEGPGHGTALIDGGKVVYTPSPGYTGTDSFDYEVCDADGACATAKVDVDVRAGGASGSPPGDDPPEDEDPGTDDDRPSDDDDEEPAPGSDDGPDNDDDDGADSPDDEAGENDDAPDDDDQASGGDGPEVAGEVFNRPAGALALTGSPLIALALSGIGASAAGALLLGWSRRRRAS